MFILDFSVFILIMLSGAVLYAAAKGEKNRYIIGITCMSIVVLLYIFGMLGFLKFCVYVVLLVSFAMYVCAIVLVIKDRDFKGFFARFLSPALVFFLLFSIMSLLMVYHRYAYEYDEFSHWMLSVKAMSILDDFTTNPGFIGSFKSYTPALPLFEYFYQKLYMLIQRTDEFNEWRVFYAFQIFGISAMLPLMGDGFKAKWGRELMASLLILFVPLFAYDNFYGAVLIDVMVGIFGGMSLAMIVIEDELSKEYVAYAVLACFIGTLTKDVGIFFTIFAGILFLIKGLLTGKRKIYIVFPILAVAAAKLSWNAKVYASGIGLNYKGSNIDIVGYTRMFLFGGNETYLQQVVNQFKAAFFEGRFVIKGLIGWFWTDYCRVFVVCILAIIAINIIYCRIRRKVEPVIIITSVVCVLITAIYIYSLGAMYCSNFGEYEAMILSSYERFMNIAYLAMFIYLAAILLRLTEEIKASLASTIMSVVCILAVIAFGPTTLFVSYLQREGMRTSSEQRYYANTIADEISKYCAPEKIVYMINQDSQPMDYIVVRFLLYSENIVGGVGIGDITWDGDLYTKNYTPDEWMDILVQSCDYVAVCRSNDNLRERYGELFENPDEINELTVYYIDKNERKLKVAQ